MSRRALLMLAACMVLMLAFSMVHVAAAVGALSADPRTGWLAALALDAGVAMLMWLVVEGEVRSARRWAVRGIALMAYMSMFANADASLVVLAGRESTHPVLIALHGSAAWQVARWLTFSLPIPAVVLVLAAVLHLDHEQVSEDDYEDEADEREVERAWAAELARREHAHDERMAALKYGRWVVPVEPTPARAPTASASDDERLAAARAHVTTHGFTTDADVSDATGVPRSTIGRWRRAGLLTPTQEAAHA